MTDLTLTQARVIDSALTVCFDIRALADLGVKIQMGTIDATMQEVFDLSKRIAHSQDGLNLTAHPERRRVAVAMFHCLAMTAFDDTMMDEIIECGLLRALRSEVA